MTQRRWVSDAFDSDELFKLISTNGGWQLGGVVTLRSEDGRSDDGPITIDYTVDVDAQWQTSRAHVEVSMANSQDHIVILRDADGWTVNGERRIDLAGCTDVDLGFTPATNTLPIRRLGLALGARGDTSAAWLRVPEMDVQRLDQSYTRLTADTYRYQSANFAAEVVVDAEGVALTYGDDLWTTA